MRSIWSGTVEFGPVIMEIKLGSSVRDNKIAGYSADPKDGSRLKQKWVSEATGNEVSSDDKVSAYDTKDGIVLLTKEDKKKAFGTSGHVASVVTFCEASNIPPMSAKKAYWIMPTQAGAKPYRLIADELQRAGKVAVVKFSMRDQESLAVLRPHEGFLALETLEFDADMLRPDFSTPPDTSTDQERELTRQFIDGMTGKYDHAEHTDASTAKLQAAIDAKAKAGQVIAAPPRAEGASTAPQDFTATLQAAVNAQKGNTEEKKPAARRRSAREKS